MANIGDVLRNLETGIEETGAFTAQQTLELYTAITRNLKRVKNDVTIEDLLALQKASMDQRRYYTSTILNMYTNQETIVQGVSSRHDVKSLQRITFNCIYAYLSNAGVFIFMELPSQQREERFILAAGSLRSVPENVSLFRVDPQGREILGPEECLWINEQALFLNSALAREFNGYTFTGPPANPKWN